MTNIIMDFLGFLIVLCTTAVSSQAISLSTKQTMPVTEGERLSFTCSVPGDPVIVQFTSTTETRPIVYWLTSGGRCDQLLLHNGSLYTASCDRTKSEFNLDILCVTPYLNKNNITCEAQYTTNSIQKENKSVQIFVNQRYPVCNDRTPQTVIQNDCPVTERNSLIVMVVLLLLIQILEFVLFVWLYRKGYIYVNKKKRAYEDIQRTRQEGQTYNEMGNAGVQCNTEQIYDDVKY